MKRISYLVITLLISSGVLIGALIGFDYGTKKNIEIQITPEIIVKDSSSLKELKSFQKEDVILIIEDEIESFVEKEFDRTTTMLNWSIVLFSIFLTVVFVFLGYFTLTKISEVKDLLERTEKLPEVMLNKHDENLLNKLLPLLNSSNPIKKNRAIIDISNNSQLKSDKHFDTLAKVLRDEFNTKSSYRRYNIIYLIDTLYVLDLKPTIDLVFDLIIEHNDTFAMENFLPHIISSDLKEHEDRLVEILTDPSNSELSHLIINDVDFSEYVRLETILRIVKKATQKDVATIMHALVRKRKYINDFDAIIKNFGDHLFDVSFFGNILTWMKQIKEVDTELTTNILNNIIDKDITESEIARMIVQLTSYIQNIDIIDNIITSLHKKFSNKYNFENIFKILRKDKNPVINQLMDNIDSKKWSKFE